MHPDNALTFYSLPEFTPASQLRVKDVKGFCTDVEKQHQIEADGSVQVTVLTSKKLRVIRLAQDVQLVKVSLLVTNILGC